MTGTWKRLLKGAEKSNPLTLEEAYFLYEHAPLDLLMKTANDFRMKHAGHKMNLCTIMNVRSGQCTEDCQFCAQSIHFKTGVDTYETVSFRRVMELAKANERQGVHRFSLVASGKAVEGQAFEEIRVILEQLTQKTAMKICVSLGCIDEQQAKALKKLGVSRYHHNIETSRGYYPSICTTHSWEERVQTIQAVKNVGLEVCCGGIWGLGETVLQRLEMAYEIKALEVDSIPINIINPIQGTPLEHATIPEPDNVLRLLALYRIIMPETELRVAGGRIALKKIQKKMLQSGISGLMVGNYLTTAGFTIEEDIVRLKQNGYEV